MNDITNTPTIHERIDGIEKLLEKFLGALSVAAPVASLIPGAAPIVGAVEAVGTVIDHGLLALEGVDPAASAAALGSISTGNDALDMRLMQIESFIESLVPLIQYVAKEFGFSALANYTAPATLALDAATAAAAANAG